MRTFILLVLALTSSASVVAQSALEAPLDRVLAAAVRADGTVDYDIVRGAQAANLSAALEAIARTRPASLGSNAEKRAFLMNAYNAHVLNAVAARPNARDIEQEDLFDALFKNPVAIAGQQLTLNQVENGLLRRQDQVDGAPVPLAAKVMRPSNVDFRIHVGLNCAAVSCPPLQPRAFRAATLSKVLTDLFVAFASSPDHIRIEGGIVVLNAIFDWFSSDFETSSRPLGELIVASMPRNRPQYDVLRQRLAGKTAEGLRSDRRVRFSYDWTINRARR